MYEKSAVHTIQLKLVKSFEMLNSFQALVGFDGYIDRLFRLDKEYVSAASISGFASYIDAQGKQSSDIKVERISEKLGGNGPILAEALSTKGINLTCIGAMGDPELCRQFIELSKHCTVISVEQPADCFAIEFADGKLMFGDTESLKRITYRHLCEKIGRGRFFSFLDGCDLFCFANWSGLPNANELLEGILTELCPMLTGKPRSLFFDLADPSALTEIGFYQFFELLKGLQSYFTVIIGLNPKELLKLYSEYFRCPATKSIQEMFSELLSTFPAHELVLHGLDYSLAGDRTHEMELVPGEFVKSPRIVTGGGDNFNAGYCLGKLLSFSPSECALLGNISSMLYVQNGTPANFMQLLNCCEQICRKE